MKKPATATRRNGTVRCAIYTRKSSEEGLEQEFNSLRAQREACEAFIESQRCWPATPPNGTQAHDIVSRASWPACCLMATAIG